MEGGMRRTGLALCSTGLLSLLLGSAGCGGPPATNGSGAPQGRGETSLRGEPETMELIQAMEDTVAARDQGREKLMAALQRVVAADRKIEGLKLTDAERKALDDRYGARKRELHKKIEE